MREGPPRNDPGLLRRRNAEIRLALLMNFPFLLDEHVEDIADSRFPDRELDRLLHEILRIHAQNPDLDAGTLKFHLTENGFGTVVDRVLSPQVLNHVASARPRADPEIVREAWSELARQIEQSGEARDMAAAERDLGGRYERRDLAAAPGRCSSASSAVEGVNFQEWR